MSDLYGDDILLWADQQAALLRRMADGERVNDQVDWKNVVEEIEDVGRSEKNAVQSLLRQALVHMLKAEAWPLSRDAPTWRADAVNFRQQAADRFAPSMAQLIDIAKLYRQAIRALPEMIDGTPPLPVNQVCPVTLEEMLAEPEG